MRYLRSLWQDRLLRRVIANSGYLFSSNSAAIALSMLQGIFAARLLGAEGFGLLSATIIPFVSTINRLTSFRMSELVVKYMGQYLSLGKKDQAAAIAKGATIADLLASAFGFLILIVVAPLAARFLAKDPQTTSLFIFYGLIILGTATFETSTGVLQLRNRFRTIAMVNLIQSLVTAGIILAAYLGERGLIEVLIAYLIGKIFLGIAISGIALSELGNTLGKGWWRVSLKIIDDWKTVGRFAISTNLSGTVNLITRDSETLWISFFRNPTEAGYFRIAMAVINLVMLPVQPLIGTTYTEIAKTIAKYDWKSTTTLLKRVSQLAGFWTLTASTVLVIFGDWVITRLYGAEFAPAYPAMLILLVGYGFANIFFWNRPLLLALGRPAFPVKVAAVAGVFKIGLGFLLVPVYGYLAEAALLSVFFITAISINIGRGLTILSSRKEETHQVS